MGDFFDLYHQIIQTLVAKFSDVSVLLPDDIKESGSGFLLPDNLFKSDTPVYRISAAQKPEEVRKTLNYSSSSAILVCPFFDDIRHLPKEYRQQYAGYHSTEAIFLLNLVRSMKNGSMLVGLITDNFLVSTANHLARKEIFELAQPTLLINHQFPWSEFGIPIHPSFQAKTIVLQKSEDNQPIRFFKLETPENEKHRNIMFADFMKLIKRDGGYTKYGYVIRDVSQIEDHWNYDYHHPDAKKPKQNLNVFGSTCLLSDIFEVQHGKINIHRDAHLLLPNDLEHKQEGIPLIEGRDLASDGKLNYETRYCVEDAPKSAVLEVGDILIRAIHALSSSEEFPIVEVTNEQGVAAASQNVIVLHPLKPLNNEERNFILAYLRSDTFKNFLRLENLSLSLQINSICRVPIPVLDEDMKVALRSLDQACHQFEEWIVELQAAKSSIFKEELDIDTRLKILSVGRLARQRVEAGQLIENFSHRIRTQFPHPLAYRWRIVEMQSQDQEGYSQILETAEISLCFLACMTIVAVNSLQGEEVKWLQTIARNLCDAHHGTSMGDWIAILREKSTAKQFRQISDLVPFYEVFRILSDESTNSAVQELKDLRDNLSHGRGPRTSRALQKAYGDAKKDLDILYRAMDFLSEYPLRYIENTRWDSIAKQNYFSYKEIRGDHSIVQISESISSNNELEAGSLYLVDRQNRYHLLRPLMIRKECPVCGSWATFFLDTFDTKTNTPIMKSMEHGHTIDEPDLSTSLRHIGVLK